MKPYKVPAKVTNRQERQLLRWTFASITAAWMNEQINLIAEQRKALGQ